jgi:hypothetical protein
MPFVNGQYYDAQGRLVSSGSPTAAAPGSSYSTSSQQYPEQFWNQIQGLNKFLADPFESFSGSLQSLLQELVPSENVARENLADTFRKAGAGTLQSGAFAQANRQLEGDILKNRGSTMTRAGLSFLAPMIQGYVGGANAVNPLSSSQSSSTAAPGQPQFINYGSDGDMGSGAENNLIGQSRFDSLFGMSPYYGSTAVAPQPPSAPAASGGVSYPNLQALLQGSGGGFFSPTGGDPTSGRYYGDSGWY